MNQITCCPECGGELKGVESCREYLNEMIKWDFEDFLGVGQVHHLTVISYNLQHPTVFSQKGLEDAKSFLVEFVDKHISFEEQDLRNRARLASSVRDWKITGSEGDYGMYENKLVWTMTSTDVFHGGLENYVENVKKWNRSVYDVLKESGNLMI